MAEMTEEQMRKLLESDADRTKGFTPEQMDEMQRALDAEKAREEEETQEEFSPGLEEDKTAPLEEEPERKVDPSQIASADTTIKEFMETLFTESPDAERMDDDDDEPAPPQTEEVVTAKEGGAIKKNADFVKDDDEEPADPPPGATPEEVADDVPAYLSTGEYVLPANVVRYIGLERIVTLHKDSLRALQQMEDLDIIENVDENGMVEEDDDEMDYLKEPEGVVKTTLVVAKPHPSGMMAMPFAQGGAPGGPDEQSFGFDPEDTSMEGFDLEPGSDFDPSADDAAGGVPDEESDPVAASTREKDPADERGFFERIEDFFTKPTPAPPVNITPEYKARQMKQAMINAEGTGLTRAQIEAEVNQLNKGLQMSPEDAAKSVGTFGPMGKIAGVGQAAMRGLVNADVVVSPDFTQELADVAEAGQSGDDTDILKQQKPLEIKEDDDKDEGPFPGYKLFPGIGYRKVEDDDDDTFTARRGGGLMGY